MTHRRHFLYSELRQLLQITFCCLYHNLASTFAGLVAPSSWTGGISGQSEVEADMCGYPRASQNGACADSATTDERAVLERAVYDQDRNAVAILYAKYHWHIRHYIASHIGPVPDVEDLAQEVFVEICEGTPRYDGRRNVEAYLHGIARRVTRSYLWREAHTIRTIPVGLADELDVLRKSRPPRGEVGMLSEEEFNRVIQDSQALLPSKACEAVKVRFVEGLSAKQAAQKLGCSVDAFRKRLQRAVRTLRCKIRERSE